MKKQLTGNKIAAGGVTLAVLVYFGVQGPAVSGRSRLRRAFAYEDQVEESIDVSGYVVREESDCRMRAADRCGFSAGRGAGQRRRHGGAGVCRRLVHPAAGPDGQPPGPDRAAEYAQAAALGTEVSLKLDSQILQGS